MYKIYMIGLNTNLDCEQELSINVKSITPFYKYSLEILNEIFQELFLRDILCVNELSDKGTFKSWTFRDLDDR
ncbi:MAG: hypothetical protein ACRC5R_00300 [Mycoplasmatales bacterium]